MDRVFAALKQAGYEIYSTNLFSAKTPSSLFKCGGSSIPLGTYSFSNYHNYIDVHVCPMEFEPSNWRVGRTSSPYVEGGVFYAGHTPVPVSEDEWFRAFTEFWRDYNNGLYYFD